MAVVLVLDTVTARFSPGDAGSLSIVLQIGFVGSGQQDVHLKPGLDIAQYWGH